MKMLVANIAVCGLLVALGPARTLAQVAPGGGSKSQPTTALQANNTAKVAMPTCWTCGDPNFGAENQCIRLGAGGPGAASCTPNVVGDWCVLDGDCQGNLPAAEMPADGANLKLPESPSALAAAKQAGVSLASIVEKVRPGVIMTRSCGGVVVARAYSVQVGATLRSQIQRIAL